MKLIKPKQISGEIMTLLDEADKEVVIISPYVKISEWKKLERTLLELKSREIEVEFYFREDSEQAKLEIERYGFIPLPIKNLHCKIYLNEKSAIVSSMNLYKFSDENSLDIAYRTETFEEFEEIRNFYNRYIKSNLIVSKIDIHDFWNNIEKKLIEILGINEYDINISYDDEGANINVGNNYWFGIDSLEFSNRFYIKGILTHQQYHYALDDESLFKEKFGLDVKLLSSDETNGYNMVMFYLANQNKINNLHELSQEEGNKIFSILLKFIERTQAFRSLFRFNYQSW
nr:hypothetical protein [uncultured Psychroserpens sp.]